MSLVPTRTRARLSRALCCSAVALVVLGGGCGRGAPLRTATVAPAASASAPDPAVVAEPLPPASPTTESPGAEDVRPRPAAVERSPRASTSSHSVAPIAQAVPPEADAAAGPSPVPSVAQPATAAEAPNAPSLFVQVSSLAPAHTPATVTSWLDRVCVAAQASSAKPDLVLQDIAAADGLLAIPYLDAIAPYAPGGSRGCFGRLFVGTVDLPWTGPGSAYVEGVQNLAARDRYVTVSATVARAFSTRYPDLVVDWYLTYEANLNALYYPEVEQAYEALLAAEMRALEAVRPHRSFLWSPAFWYPHSAYSKNTAGMAQLTTQLTKLFASLRQATDGGLQVLALQDFVAGSSCQPPTNRVTPSDALAWSRFLATLPAAPQVALNVEQYAIDCVTGAYGPAPARDIAERESFYLAQGATLGPAFEIRYWAGIS